MDNLAYPGSSFEVVMTLGVPAASHDTIIGLESHDWLAPAILELRDDTGMVWVSEPYNHLANPNLIGSQYLYEYPISVIIPDMPSGTYSLVLTRSIVSSQIRVTVEAPFSDAHGAQDVLEVNTSTGFNLVLIDRDPSAVVEYQIHHLDASGQQVVLPGSATAQVYGDKVVFTSSTIDPSAQGMVASLNSKTVMWKITSGGMPRSAISSVFIFNVTMLQAANDLRMFFERLHQEARLPELQYNMADYARWLMRGAEMFNAGGLFTNFTMTNATGVIRHWWLVCSTIWALKHQYLAEGMRSFQFSGQSVTADVNVTEYLTSLASDLKGEWESAQLTTKQQLAQYGLKGGPGDAAAGKFQVGGIGISISPASNFTGYFANRSLVRFN